MSAAALERIVRRVEQKAGAVYDPPLHDADCNTLLSMGDWKDAINVELKKIKIAIESVADGLEARHDSDDQLATAAVLRFAVKDL